MRRLPGFAPKLTGVYSSKGRIRKKQLKDPKGAASAYAGELPRFPVSREANEFFARTAAKPETRNC
jgi:hypothetical protein